MKFVVVVVQWLAHWTVKPENQLFETWSSRCFLRQETLLLILSPHPGVQMSSGDMMLGVTLQRTNVPSREEYRVLQCDVTK